jgi:hypothetical protein
MRNDVAQCGSSERVRRPAASKIGERSVGLGEMREMVGREHSRVTA